MTVTPCTCTEPGWCERHKVHKTLRWFQLCQTDLHHFQAWEIGRGLGQPALLVGSSEADPLPIGPGTQLLKVIGRCCAFPHWLQMNEWGPAGCEEHLPEIITWLQASSAQQRIPLSSEKAEHLIRLAIKLARDMEAEKRPSWNLLSTGRPGPPDLSGSADPG